MSELTFVKSDLSTILSDTLDFDSFDLIGLTAVLRGHGVAISMDGRGCFADNIFVERLWRSLKYEEVYLKAYNNVAQARHGITAYFKIYNHQRLHQALGYRTPH